MPLLEIKIEDPRGNVIGHVNALDNNGERYYYTKDFEEILKFSTMKCSSLPYLLGSKKVKLGKYIVATWEDIHNALSRIQKPNSYVEMMLQRKHDPSIQPVIDIQHSKIFRFFDSMKPDHELLIRLTTFHKAVNDFSAYQKQWPDFKFTFQDLFRFSALEMSELLQKISIATKEEIEKANEAFPEPESKPEQEQKNNSINVPLPNGGSISLTINLNIGGKNE